MSLLDFTMGMIAGWSLGFGACRFYFHLQKLVRTREEWLAAKAKEEE